MEERRVGRGSCATTLDERGGSMSEDFMEHDDSYVYDVYFSRDTFHLIVAAIRHYKSLLDAGKRAVLEDSAIGAFMDESTFKTFPVARDMRTIDWLLERLEKTLSDQVENNWDYDFRVTHGNARILKSASLLYLDVLAVRRDEIANRPDVARAVVEALDEQLARLRELLETGIFSRMSTVSLAFDQLPQSSGHGLAHVQASPSSAGASPPVVLDSIQIRDPQLRSRCLDLVARFDSDGEHERLDTVLNEATRILEDRIRTLSGAEPELIGVDLARFAFAPPNHRIVLSDITAEQEGAHLLFRGVFGFVRNAVHHRLVDDLQPQRVLQILGMIDYLIFVAESGMKAGGPAPVV
ncbi:MAG: TIGR02391 family protein [Actinomycetota bacterium]|nr:TIGR02391 family protein [Actinomycetota bacterium]